MIYEQPAQLPILHLDIILSIQADYDCNSISSLPMGHLK